MTGWISIYREIQDHWIWQDERHLKWWLTILLNVNHEEKKFPVGCDLFTCKPGQSFKSIEQWTAMFSCSKKTTVKFFELLEKEKMIKREILGRGNRRKHLLTVQNWDKFQRKETEKETETVPKTTPKEYSNIPPNNNDNNGNKNDIKIIVEYLNSKSGKNFKPRTKKTQSLIQARINEGYSIDDFKRVVDNKCSQWLNKEHDQYLRPETLFGPKFEGYFNEKQINGNHKTQSDTLENWRKCTN
ncbi:conserved phage C-terminal domain-containing protein [Sunxiuqinia sp. A32]|uniref:conserved phage C-terminal domain-containing protein n=1 Tax=Sunxiuqinia sp. A32 TaxID=3461496 RepID=UPI0040456264